MDSKTAALAFDPRGVQQALHALERRERDAGTEEVLGELAQTLAALGSEGGADVDRKRGRLTHGPGQALLKHAAKLLAGDAPSRNRELAKAHDAQADAIGRLA